MLKLTCIAELFGRPHNLRNGWTTVGNQLDGVRLKDLAMQQRVVAFLDKQREEQRECQVK